MSSDSRPRRLCYSLYVKPVGGDEYLEEYVTTLGGIRDALCQSVIIGEADYRIEARWSPVNKADGQ